MWCNVILFPSIPGLTKPELHGVSLYSEEAGTGVSDFILFLFLGCFPVFVGGEGLLCRR